MKVFCTLILMLVSLSSWGQSPLPDERVLWQLLHAGRLRLLSQAIEEYHRNHPGWEPPAALVKELRRRRHRQHAKPPGNFIAAIIRQQDWPRLIRLARKHPRLFDCRHPGRLQALALAYGNTGDAETAFRHYRRLLGCPGVDAEAVLRQALWQLPPGDFDALLEQARGKLNPAAWDRLHYQSRRRRLLSLNREGKLPSLLHEAEPLAHAIIAHRDLDLIRLLGWAAYRRKDWQAAKFWFRAGLALAPEDESLAYGLALAYRQLQQDQALLRLAERFPQSARIPHLAGGYLLTKAWQAYHRNRYKRARDLAQRARPWLEQPEEADYLLGWIAMQTGQIDKGRLHFEQLYRSHPADQRYAEALVIAYLRSGMDIRVLENFPTMRPIAHRYLAQRLYERKRFLSAYHEDSAAFPQLANIDTPSIYVEPLYRYKSGTKGLDRLQTLIDPLFSAKYTQNHHQFNLNFKHITISSGKIKAKSLSRELQNEISWKLEHEKEKDILSGMIQSIQNDFDIPVDMSYSKANKIGIPESLISRQLHVTKLLQNLPKKISSPINRDIEAAIYPKDSFTLRNYLICSLKGLKERQAICTKIIQEMETYETKCKRGEHRPCHPEEEPSDEIKERTASEFFKELDDNIIDLEQIISFLKQNNPNTPYLEYISSEKLDQKNILKLLRSLPEQTPALAVLEGIAITQNPPTHRVDANTFGFTYKYENYSSLLNFHFGFTPMGGTVRPRPTFRLRLKNIWKPSQKTVIDWSTELYSLPVRQSILSYTGWKVLGKKWGRVLRSGIKVDGIISWDEKWNVYEYLDAAFLDGKNTKDNWTINYTLAPSYTFNLHGLDYLSIGPYFNFQHYGNNQNHFRYGHGGYFSPQRFYATGIQTNFRTEEGNKWIADGQVNVGVQHYYEAQEEWYPIGCPYPGYLLCRLNYPPNRDTNFSPSLRLRLTGLIHPHLQIGAGLFASKTGDYKEIGGGIFVRFFLEPRKGVFSSDLPPSLFAAIE